MKASRVAALGAAVALPAPGVLFRYRGDMNAARTPGGRGPHVVSTEWGRSGIAEQGHGEPVLVAHRILHN